jgi:hypothetical protein
MPKHFPDCIGGCPEVYKRQMDANRQFKTDTEIILRLKEEN